uniref:Uncharacterized protein n=1 Tax=Myoviridae sp. ctt8G1 TaxID=2827713 RepID=A0A8S5TFZ7_9CAUD|nr:MAG TPA: hypothetical protein [Myoviridae sp. ctt8G1]
MRGCTDAMPHGWEKGRGRCSSPRSARKRYAASCRRSSTA